MLTVVIPTFNTAQMTLRCCRALHAGCEVIVVDDGSTDGTAELFARELPHVRVVRLAMNRGFAAAANAGVAEARGELILLLNSDALVHAGAVEAMLRAFAEDERLGIAGARLLDEDGTPQWSGGPIPTLPWLIGVVSGLGKFAKSFRRARGPQSDVDWVSGAAMAVRADVWRDAGPLSERFLFYCQDLELCVRARRAGWRVRIVEDARVMHLRGATAGRSVARLWPDLLTWGREHYGRRWGALARVVLMAIVVVRIATRSGDVAAMKQALRRM